MPLGAVDRESKVVNEGPGVLNEEPGGLSKEPGVLSEELGMFGEEFSERLSDDADGGRDVAELGVGEGNCVAAATEEDDTQQSPHSG